MTTQKKLLGQLWTVTSVSVGNVKSLDDAKGPYTAFGGSYSPDGISVGFDLMQNLKNEYVGSVISLGFGAGGNAEVHKRLGFTGIKSVLQEN